MLEVDRLGGVPPAPVLLRADYAGEDRAAISFELSVRPDATGLAVAVVRPAGP